MIMQVQLYRIVLLFNLFVAKINLKRIAYRRFDTIVHCKNDAVSLKPKGIINAETAKFYTDAFSGLTHEVVRSTATSIDVKVKWSSTLAPYVTNALFEMIAPVALGSVSFSNIYGTF